MVVRPFTRADVDGLLALWRDDEVARWTGVPADPTEALALAWIDTRTRREAAGRGIDRAVTLDAAFAGVVALDRTDEGAWSLSWSVLPAYRGRGVATAAARTLLAGAPPGPVVVEVEPANVASQRVAAKLGDLVTTTIASPSR